MDDDSMPLPNYVTPRNGVYQYVRRVPDDIADVFVSPRIQRSLKTRLPSEARLRAAELDRDIERQFAEARRRKGINTEFVSTAGWSWVEWSRVVEWLKATWLHQDQSERSKGVLGSHFSAEPGSKLLWLSDDALRRKLDLRRRLLAFTPEQYGRKEGTRLAETLKPIGLALPSLEPYRSEFLTACLQAEVEAIEIIFQREGGERIAHSHPDSIDGAWRRSSTHGSPSNDTDRLPQKAAISVEPPVVSPAIPASQDEGRSLSDCIDEWIRERLRLRKKVDSHLVNDMRATTAWFTKFTKVVTIDDIRRRHVISFRDHLFDKGDYKTATINKKVGFITSLISLAAAKGWVETAIEGGIYIEIPSDEDKRDSYSADELATLFSSPVFTRGQRSSSVKSGGELQFWLPLIACCHGLISSEILQLGYDTVAQHPGTDIWCFRVTNAGGRMIKTYARERYVPIRHEFLELGILDLAENAQKRNWTTLWAALEQPGGTVTNISNYFSAYWTTFSRKQLGTVPARKSLYSFRHAFKDELDRQKTPLEIKQALMGHSDGGTTGRYGSKSTPRPVNAGILQNSINELEWKFLSNVRSR